MGNGSSTIKDDISPQPDGEDSISDEVVQQAFIKKCNSFETSIDFYDRYDVYHSPLGLITDTSHDDHIIHIIEHVDTKYDNVHEISKILYFYILYIIKHKCIIQRQHKFTPSLYFIQSLLSQYCFKNNKSSIRDCLKCIQKYGVIDTIYYNENTDWESMLSIAKDYNTITFSRIHNTIGDIKNTLHGNLPIIIHLPIYSHFIDIGINSDGEYTLPSDDDTLIGSLCGLLIGYIESKSMYVVKLSIADNFGDKGVIYVPFTFICTYVKDLWILDVHIDFFENYKKIKMYDDIVTKSREKKKEDEKKVSLNVDKKNKIQLNIVDRSRIKPKIIYF